VSLAVVGCAEAPTSPDANSISCRLCRLRAGRLRASPCLGDGPSEIELAPNHQITGIRQAWTFDEFYTAMAVEGLDTNKDGVYSKEELAPLAKVNVESLKEFDYFTFVPRLA
jgi:hypothetical protein